MMALLPLFCAALLTACDTPTAAAPDSLYTAKPYPNTRAIAQNPNSTQKDVAKVLVRSKTAYDSCVVNLEALKTLANNKGN